MPDRRRLPPIVATALAVVAVGSALGACSRAPERSVANYCSQAGSLVALDGDLGSGDPITIGARADDLRRLDEVAPPEIQPSVQVLLGITDNFATVAGTATDRSGIADEVFRGRGAELGQIEAAGTAVADYTRQNCQLEVRGGTGTGPMAGTGSPDAPTTTSSDVTSDGGSPGDGSADPGPSGGPSTTTTSSPSLLVP